jgi:hypothetical protein
VGERHNSVGGRKDRFHFTLSEFSALLTVSHPTFTTSSRLRSYADGEVIMMTNESNRNGVTRVAGVVCVMLMMCTSAWAQAVPRGVTKIVDMSGPRFGLTVLNQATVDRLLEKKNITVQPMITQLGWQFERRLYTNGDGTTMLTEWIPLLSGLDQGVAMPSLNWMVGLRTSSGTEFGIGPNITPLGVGLVAAAGVTVKAGALHVPFNFAVATSKSGARISVMTGWNVRKR